MVEGVAVAYSSLYQEIVEGHRNGTRELYVLVDAKTAKWRPVTMEEEFEKLEKGFEELIAWDQMVAKSRLQCAINRERFHGVELEDILKTSDIDQAGEYIEEKAICIIIAVHFSVIFQNFKMKYGNKRSLKAPFCAL